MPLPTVSCPLNNMAAALTTAEQALAERFASIHATEYTVFERVLSAFRAHKVSESHFYSVSGYGHDDIGRETLDKVAADCFMAEAAMVRPHWVSGTHAIATALRGCLQPGQHMLCLTGRPYDTLEEVIGLRGKSSQSLTAWGVTYEEIAPFDDDGALELAQLATEKAKASMAKANMLYIQRSCGYATWRQSVSVADIQAMVAYAKTINPTAVVVVDNCYGEFVEATEPTAVGADIVVGSLIKNPGAGLAESGGYIAGKTEWVNRCADAWTAPGVGAKGGAMQNTTRTLLQGLFLAPSVVASAVKGMVLAAHLFNQAGYKVSPVAAASRTDIIQTIELGSGDALKTFCKVLQANSPVDSHLTPQPDQLPGYQDPVLMAGGTFVQGSTIELSADGPMRPPYAAFMQGGLSYAHVRTVLAAMLPELVKLH